MTMLLYLEIIGISLVVAIIVAVAVTWIDRVRRQRRMLKWYAKPNHSNITFDPDLPKPRPRSATVSPLPTKLPKNAA